MRDFVEKVQDLWEGIQEDPRKQMIFVGVCAFVIGFAVGSL